MSSTDSASSEAPITSAPGQTCTDEVRQYGSAARMVTPPVRIAAAWSWRVVIIIGAVGLIGWLLGHVATIVIPVLIAALLAGLLMPAVRWLRSKHVPAALAVLLVEGGMIIAVLGLLALAGQQIIVGFAKLSDSAMAGFHKLMGMLEDSPLHVSTDNINQWMSELGDTLQRNSDAILSSAMNFGSTAGNILTGTVIMLFVLLFFLLDGENIWLFLVKMFPKRSQPAVNGAGRRGWTSLGQYVRIQVFVAFVDAAGIGLGAFFLGVPLALPIGVLVFLASFIPIVGAVLTGAIAVLVALVALGVGKAIAMLLVVLIVQQVESNVLQPLVMGKAVSLHPVAVFLSVAVGAVLFGIPGALFSVPLLAVVNTIVRYLANRMWEHDDELAWQPLLYPWEIKKAEKKKDLSREQVMQLLQRFRLTSHKDREVEEKKRKRKNKKQLERNSSADPDDLTDRS